MARLPCLATFTPAPAAMSAAVVDMLKLPDESPPVPQVSTTAPTAETRRDFSRIARAMPAISSTVSPFSRMAAASAPICAGVASPDMIAPIARAASSADSEPPETTVSIASRIVI